MLPKSASAAICFYGIDSLIELCHSFIRFPRVKPSAVAVESTYVKSRYIFRTSNCLLKTCLNQNRKVRTGYKR